MEQPTNLRSKEESEETFVWSNQGISDDWWELVGVLGGVGSLQSCYAALRHEEDGGAAVVGLLIGRVNYGDLAIVASGRKAIECNAETECGYAKSTCWIGLHGCWRSFEDLAP